MDVTPRVPAGRQIIQGYGDGGFRIAGIRHRGAVLIFADRTEEWTSPDGAPPVDRMTREEPPIELLLVGTGRRMRPLTAEERRRFREAGIMVEAMDTGAACRTFNVLLGEGRRVAAALIAV